MNDLWRDYRSPGFFDEAFDDSGQARSAANALVRYLGEFGRTELETRRAAADLAIKSMGITFTVYSDAGMIDRAWPFDILPRPIPKH